jgi:hypothetical protein
MSRIKMALCAGVLALGLAFAMPAVSQASVSTVCQPAVAPVAATAYQPVAYRSYHRTYRSSWYRGCRPVHVRHYYHWRR